MFTNTYIRTYQDEITRDLSELIRIPSVYTGAEPDAPFGPGPRDALTYMLRRGRELGFTTKNVDNYAGHVEYGTTGPLIGVLVHLDVVPAGEGWKHDPFGGEIEDGMVFGRGASDNKGPAVAALYVLRALADQLPDPPARFRVIFGTNEENGMEGVRRYFQQEELPDFGFAPDAAYPLYNREKGIVNVHLQAPRTGPYLLDALSGGEALNMVPDEARAGICAEYIDRALPFLEKLAGEESMEHRIGIEHSAGKLVVTAKGVSAHGARPVQGINAISILVSALAEFAREIGRSASVQVEPELRWLSRLVGFETRGDSLGIACRDKESGELGVNWGTVKIDENGIHAGLNLRYPVTANYDEITRVLTMRAKRYGFSVRFEHHLEPLFIPEDDPLVQRLLAAYEGVTGERKPPMSMSGGTYARMLKNRGVAFGAGFIGEENNVHQPEERIVIESLMRHAEISLQALYELSLPAATG